MVSPREGGSTRPSAPHGYADGILSYTEAITKMTASRPFATVLPEVRHDAQITCVCVSSKSDERYIVCGSADAKLSVFDRHLNHRQALLVEHDDQVGLVQSDVTDLN